MKVCKPYPWESRKFPKFGRFKHAHIGKIQWRSMTLAKTPKNQAGLAEISEGIPIRCMTAKTRPNRKVKPVPSQFTVAYAKAHLEELLELAISSREPLTIKHGAHLFEIQPMEFIPLHSYVIDDEWAEEMASHPVDCFVPSL